MIADDVRDQLLWFEVTHHQITEAFPWASAPAYLVQDNDRAYGHVFTSRVRAMGENTEGTRFRCALESQDGQRPRPDGLSFSSMPVIEVLSPLSQATATPPTLDDSLVRSSGRGFRHAQEATVDYIVEDGDSNQAALLNTLFTLACSG